MKKMIFFQKNFKIIEEKKYGISKNIFFELFKLKIFFVSFLINSTAG